MELAGGPRLDEEGGGASSGRGGSDYMVMHKCVGSQTCMLYTCAGSQ